ncbi:hypothetical protein CRYUN_Cryun38cG0052200 [Craigia yunnanensis]
MDLSLEWELTILVPSFFPGNTNTLTRNVPPKANLGDLRGLAGGLNELNSSTIIDGGEFDGGIAKTGLFREQIPLFRLLFPPFQKYITKGFVSKEEVGKRLAQVCRIGVQYASSNSP